MTEQQKHVHGYCRERGFLPMGPDQFEALYDFKGDNTVHEITATVCAIWAFAYSAVYKELHGYLCSVWFYHEGDVRFLVQRPAVPEFPLSRIVEDLYALALDAGLPALEIWPVEERFLAEYEAPEGFRISSVCNEDWGEYVYRPGDILELSGGPNTLKRRRLKKCLEISNITTCPLTKDNFDICFTIEEEWCRQRDCACCESFGGCAKKSLENMAVIFDEQYHQGMLAFVDSVPAGYAIWEITNEKILFVYFSKSSRPDLNLFLYYTIAKDRLLEIEHINNGADMGKPGLRVFKQHLGIHELLRKYRCTFVKG
jgi:hypothetical protein